MPFVDLAATKDWLEASEANDNVRDSGEADSCALLGLEAGAGDMDMRLFRLPRVLQHSHCITGCAHFPTRNRWVRAHHLYSKIYKSCYSPILR